MGGAHKLEKTLEETPRKAAAQRKENGMERLYTGRTIRRTGFRSLWSIRLGARR